MHRFAAVLALSFTLAAYLVGCGGGQALAPTTPPTTTATPTSANSQGTAGPAQPTLTPGQQSATPSVEPTLPPEDCSLSIPDDLPPPDFPPAPGDASGMLEWFAAACPGAAWLSRILAIEHVPGEVPASGGFANAIVITTDLDFATEQQAALEIATALGEAHPTWAAQYVIWYADGRNETAGDIIDMTP